MSARRRRVLLVIGTRPEAIKLAPVFREAERCADLEVLVVLTGQHREMVDQVVPLFELRIDHDLDLMRHDQTLASVATAALGGLTEAYRTLQPDCVVVQGDTTSTFCGALAAFYLDIPVAHVEAGLRTYDLRQPFPEEANRRLVSPLATYHFAPTDLSAANLRAEQIPDEQIWITGNTAIDALFHTLGVLRARNDARPAGAAPQSDGRRNVLLTAHRRENHGDGMEQICDAVLDLVERYDDLSVTYPVHPSPRVRATVGAKLAGRPRIELVEPLDYEQFVAAMDASHLILTDSGGVQEEAPSLGKPVLVLREVTERPEARDAGVAVLVGADRERIVTEACRLLDDTTAYAEMAARVNPYGDGRAAERIVAVLNEGLNG